MVTQHTSRQYDQEMDELRDRLLGMGALGVEQLARVHKSLAQGAVFSSDEIESIERAINHEHVEIDALCTRVIVKRQPAAVDLRHILSTIHAINDLERIGDEAKKVLHKTQTIPASFDRSLLSEMGSMSAMVLEMLKLVLQCVERQDIMGAYDVLRMDARVDIEFDAAMSRLEKAMAQQPDAIRTLLDLAFVAKAIERCGDHAKNIAEEVVAMVRGEDVRHRPDNR